jgi:hypothetical protein
MEFLRNRVGGVFSVIRRAAGLTALACACVLGTAGSVMVPTAWAGVAAAAPEYDYFTVQKGVWTTLFASDWKEDAEYALDKRVDGAGEYQGLNENGEAFIFKAVGSLPVKLENLNLTPAEQAWATQNQITFSAVMGVVYTEQGAVAISGLAGTAKTAQEGFQSRLLINDVIDPNSAVFGAGFGELNAAANGETLNAEKEAAQPEIDPACALACVNAYNAAVAAANAAWQQATRNANQQFQDSVDFAKTDFNLCVAQAAATYTAAALRCMIPSIRIWRVGGCIAAAARTYSASVAGCLSTYNARLAAAQAALNAQTTAINNARARALERARADLTACLNGCIIVPATR